MPIVEWRRGACFARVGTSNWAGGWWEADCWLASCTRVRPCTRILEISRWDVTRSRGSFQGFEICQLSWKWRSSDPKKFALLRLSSPNAGGRINDRLAAIPASDTNKGQIGPDCCQWMDWGPQESLGAQEGARPRHKCHQLGTPTEAGSAAAPCCALNIIYIMRNAVSGCGRVRVLGVAMAGPLARLLPASSVPGQG